MKIEDRVRLAFDLGLNHEFLPMMSIILPAIEGVAKQNWNAGGKKGFFRFMRENYDVIEWFMGRTLDLSRLRFLTLKPEFTDGKLIPNPDLAEVVNHLHRCSLAHGQDIAEHFAILPRGSDGSIAMHIGKEGNMLRLPEPLVWGLLASVVLDPSNLGREKKSNYHFLLNLPPNNYTFDLDLFWGEKGKVSNLVSRYAKPDDETTKIMDALSGGRRFDVH